MRSIRTENEIVPDLECDGLRPSAASTRCQDACCHACGKSLPAIKSHSRHREASMRLIARFAPRGPGENVGQVPPEFAPRYLL
jgi:hypothetical protein